jgi:hypothetical protein
MENFKGTKGKWSKQQVGNGDIEISANSFRNLATVNFYPAGFREKYINNKLTGSPSPDSSEYRIECLYNALLITKAPEILEMLSLVADVLEDAGKFEFQKRVENLIKEATTLK